MRSFRRTQESEVYHPPGFNSILISNSWNVRGCLFYGLLFHVDLMSHWLPENFLVCIINENVVKNKSS